MDMQKADVALSQTVGRPRLARRGGALTAQHRHLNLSQLNSHSAGSLAGLNLLSADEQLAFLESFLRALLMGLRCSPGREAQNKAGPLISLVGEQTENRRGKASAPSRFVVVVGSSLSCLRAVGWALPDPWGRFCRFVRLRAPKNAVVCSPQPSLSLALLCPIRRCPFVSDGAHGYCHLAVLRALPRGLAAPVVLRRRFFPVPDQWPRLPGRGVWPFVGSSRSGLAACELCGTRLSGSGGPDEWFWLWLHGLFSFSSRRKSKLGTV